MQLICTVCEFEVDPSAAIYQPDDPHSDSPHPDDQARQVFCSNRCLLEYEKSPENYVSDWQAEEEHPS